MFLRHWSGLPEDVSFPSGLKNLGYFVNDEDEIRSIENPDFYFKFFLNRNERVNHRQRFSFNLAIEDVVHKRLEAEGLEKTLLPLGTPANEPHVPILASRNLTSRSRIVVFFGEPIKDLGILALRVVNGPGGVNKGSMVSVVRELQKQAATDTDASPPGVILANTGQSYWWPEGKRCLSVLSSQALPLPSLVHLGWRHVPSANEVAGNENPTRHVKYIFEDVFSKLVHEKALIDIVAVGESCDIVQKYLDDAVNWSVWGPRLNAMLLMSSVYGTDHLTNMELKSFLAQRTRGYAVSHHPLDLPLASPAGNPNEAIPPLGCPCFSSSEPFYPEMVLIRALEPALGYLQQVALCAGRFENPPIVVVERPQAGEEGAEVPVGLDWDQLADHEKPLISVADPQAMKEEIRQARRWDKFMATGRAPEESDSDEAEV